MRGRVALVLALVLFPSFFAAAESECGGNCRVGCTKEGVCYEGCVNGFWGETCDHNCSATCNQGFCYQYTGACNWGCETGWWGILCDNKCSSHCKGGACSSQDGVCTDGCAPGWRGSSCLQAMFANAACQPGQYGDGCRETCGQCLQGTCHHVTGDCTGGCQDGWRGPRCDQECENGTYGESCESQCGECLHQPCHHVNGSCLGGCQSGMTGDLCKDDCSQGDCQFLSCDDDDSCPEHCPDGWVGSACNQTCSAGSYGTNCSYACGRCLDNAVCDHVTGSCPAGCKAGWDGPRCFQECKDGTYGEGCTKTCGQCAGGVACDKEDGTCTACQEGLTPPLCLPVTENKHGGETGGSEHNFSCTSNCDTDLWTRIGIGFGVSCPLVFMALAIVYVRRLCHRHQDSGQSAKYAGSAGKSRGSDGSAYFNNIQEEAELGEAKIGHLNTAKSKKKDHVKM